MQATGIAAVAITTFALAGAAAAQTVNLVEKQGVWSLYADTATPKAVCFIAAQPQAVEPLGANRGPIFFYISAWPKDGVKTEPSIKVGYPVKPDADMSVTVGTDTFKLFIKGERGFVSDPDRGAEAGRGPEEGIQRLRQSDLGARHGDDRHLFAVGPLDGAGEARRRLPVAARSHRDAMP